MKFEEVIGQEAAKRALQKMIDEDRVPHALMFCGPAGCGKLALAMAFASRLLKDSHLLRRWTHPDLHFTYPTIKKPGMGSEHQPVSDDFAREWRNLIADGPYFALEQWLEAMGAENQQAVITGGESDALARKLSVKSGMGGYRVCIIWLPERMNLTSANKMLKLLEEPPARTVFLLVSEDPGMLLETIRSRVQRVQLRRLDDTEIADALQQRRGLSPETALRTARMAGGSWLTAIQSLRTDSENRMFLDLFTMLMRRAYTRSLPELKQWSDSVATLGRERQKRFLRYFSRMIRESFMYNFHAPQLSYMTLEEEEFAKRFAPFINEANILEFADMADMAMRDISQNANAKFVLSDMALHTIILVRKRP